MFNIYICIYVYIYIYIYIYIYERNVDQDICLDIRTVIKQSMNWEEGMNAFSCLKWLNSMVYGRYNYIVNGGHNGLYQLITGGAILYQSVDSTAMYL